MTIDTTYLDEGSDKIKLARPALLATAQQVNAHIVTIADHESRIGSLEAGGTGGSPVSIQDEGTMLTADVTNINFTGSGVTATNVGGAVTVTIPGGGTGGGASNAVDVSYTPSGTGAVTSNVQAKLRESVSVTDFGAVGDGAADCLTAFTNALAASAGKKLRIPAGNYRIPFTGTTALTPPANIVIEGDGKEVTTITFVPTSTSYPAAFGLSNNNFTLRGIKVVLEVPMTTGNGFVFRLGGTGVTLQDCDFDGAVTNTGVTINSETYCWSVPASGTVNDVNVSNCDIHRFRFPLLKTNASTCTNRRWSFSDCDFFENYNEDLGFNSPNGVMDDVQVYMCRFRDTNGGATNTNPIYVAFASVTNFRVGGCSFTGDNGTGGQAIHIEENCIGGVVSGNVINVRGYGIEINGNNISGSIYTPSNISITGNTITKYGTSKEASSIGIGLIFNASLHPPAKNLIIDGNTVSGYENGILSNITLNDGCCITDNYVENCTNGLNFRDGAVTTSGNTTANCTVGIAASAHSGSVFDSATVEDHTFITCTANVDSTEMPITLLNPKFVFAEFDHAGGSTSVYKDCLALGSNDRVHGYLEIIEDCDSTSSYSRTRDEVTWDGTTFTRTNKMTIQPGNINTMAARNASILAVQVFSSAARTNVRVQAKLNGMAVVAV